MVKFFLSLALLALWAAISNTAQASLKLSLITLEPGPTLFEAFGHAALLLEDSDNAERVTIYQYGTVDARSFWSGRNPLANFQKLFENKLPTAAEKLDGVAVDLATGISEYLTGNGGREGKINARSSRKAFIDRLDLTDEQLSNILAALDIDVDRLRPIRYAYHAFEANCATKIRDRLFSDGVLGSALRLSIESKKIDSSLQELSMQSIDEAAKLSASQSVQLGPAELLRAEKSRSALEMLGVPKNEDGSLTTDYADARIFLDVMQATEKALRANKLITLAIGQAEHERQAALFHEYFFGPSLLKAPISEYEAMFLPKLLRAALLNTTNPATNKPLVGAATIVVSKIVDGFKAEKIQLRPAEAVL